jgi:3-oxoacyl-[acyl-carrier protein] reductase
VWSAARAVDAATSNVIRCAWVGEAKTLAVALGEKGIHVNTLSLGGIPSPWSKEGVSRAAPRRPASATRSA